MRRAEGVCGLHRPPPGDSGVGAHGRPEGRSADLQRFAARHNESRDHPRASQLSGMKDVLERVYTPCNSRGLGADLSLVVQRIHTECESRTNSGNLEGVPRTCIFGVQPQKIFQVKSHLQVPLKIRSKIHDYSVSTPIISQCCDTSKNPVSSGTGQLGSYMRWPESKTSNNY